MLFKKIPDEKKRLVRVPIRFTDKEAQTVRYSADVRTMTVSEFIRRAALGRKAEVQFGHQIILELREVGAAIRALHREYVVQGIEPPEKILRPVIDELVNAILRVSK